MRSSLLAILLLATAGHCGVVKWRLPLGIGPNDDTEALALASDATTLYTANTRGTIFAIDAASGEVKWSADGDAALLELYAFPSIPDLLYSLSVELPWSYPGQGSLRALRRSDGVEVAHLRNLSEGKVATTAIGLVFLRDNAVYSTDPHLRLLWKQDPPPDWRYWWFAASNNLVAAVGHRKLNDTDFRGVSFDALTGDVVCNISQVDSPVTGSYGWPFLLTEDGQSVAYKVDVLNGGISDEIRVVDFRRCAVKRTKTVNNEVAFPFPIIIPPTNYSDAQQRTLYFAFDLNRSTCRCVPSLRKCFGNANLTTTRGTIGTNDTWWSFPMESSCWFDLTNVVVDPVVSVTSPGSPDSVFFWFMGALTEIDAATGATRWSPAPTLIPAAPATVQQHQPQAVFPLGDGSTLFVPNLVGYVVLQLYTGGVAEVTYNDATIATTQFRDSAGQYFALSIGQSGDVFRVG